MEYYVSDGEIKSKYTDRVFSLEEVCRLLNRLEIEARRNQNDLIKSIELKAINRHLRMENRFLTVKLHKIGYESMSITLSDIEKELQDLCLNPKKASDYINKFEKENFELKKKLKELGEYSGDLL